MQPFRSVQEQHSFAKLEASAVTKLDGDNHAPLAHSFNSGNHTMHGLHMQQTAMRLVPVGESLQTLRALPFAAPQLMPANLPLRKGESLLSGVQIVGAAMETGAVAKRK